jgi:tetratricopeptide (TPR) repeat protein
VAPASRAVRTARVPPVDVSSLIARGCYDCLRQAFDAASEEGARARVSEAALLLAARSKELGLPFEPWLERARSSLPAGPDWTMYVEIVKALRIDPLSGDKDAILTELALRRAGREQVSGWREDLKVGPGSPVFRTYLDLSLACGFQATEVEGAVASARETFADMPLIVYRIGLCGVGSQSPLVAMREADPGFVDLDLPIARFALDVSQQPDQEEALRRFAGLQAAFPESPVFPASIGSVHQEREEWSDALGAYEAALALVPEHRDALLGRIVSLSNLARHGEAIAAATRLLELGNWFMGAGHFWRAWNNYHLGQIESARGDVDRAKTLMVNAPTFVLSGMIDWRQKQLEASEREFVEALKVDAGQCEAAAMLGTVRTEKQLWAEAAAAFQQAVRCFDLTVTVRREVIARIESGPGSEAGKAHLIATQERVIAEAERHRDDAAQNVDEIMRRLGPSSR